jgi:uncharacterized membrane protein affecting hemolysin expression
MLISHIVVIVVVVLNTIIVMGNAWWLVDDQKSIRFVQNRDLAKTLSSTNTVGSMRDLDDVNAVSTKRPRRRSQPSSMHKRSCTIRRG